MLKGACGGQTHSTNTKQHENNMHFGHISSYVNGGRDNMHLNGILWWLEILITQFNIMVKDIQNVFKQLTEDEKY